MKRLALAAVLTVACGSSSGTTPPSNRDGASDVASAPADAGAVCSNIPDYTSADRCNTVPNTAVAVPFSEGAGDPPTFGGGTIVDGVYQATKVEGWNASSKTGRRFTLVVAEQGQKIFWSGDVLYPDGSSSQFLAITRVASAGDQLALSLVCSNGGAGLPGTMSYTATPTQLVLAATQGSALSVTTYTRVGCP